MPRRRAFSLIEVTIVILLLGITAAVTAPRFAAAVRVMHLKAAAQQLAAHVEFIRTVALNEGRSTSLICDNVAHTYRSDVDFPERIGEPIFVSIATDFDPSITLTANFDSQTTMTFDFDGVPHVGANPMVNGQIVLATGDDSIAITIGAGAKTTTMQGFDSMGATSL